MNNVIFLSALLVLIKTIESSELKFVFVMVRGPDHKACNYPGGPLLTQLPEKESNLTEDGKKEAYELGKLLDLVYRNQLKVKTWDATKNYWAVATSTKRTKEAALIIGAGLENNEQKAKGTWSEAQLNSTHFDAMPGFLRFLNPQQCPNFFIALSQQNKAIKKLFDKHQDAIQAIKNKFPSIDVTKPQHIWIAYETFKRMQQQHMEEVKGLNSSVIKKLKEFSSQYLKIATMSTNQIRKLVGGLILYDLFNDMDELTKGNAQPHAPGAISNKMNIFVVPQVLLAAQMAVFMPEGAKLSNQDIKPSDFYPDDGSYVTIEMHQEKNNEWKVQIKYKNSKNSGWRPLKLKECDAVMCSYNKFKDTLKKYVLSDSEHKIACGTPTK